MIYLDTSVVLAHLLAEDRAPPDALWSETLVSSRLTEYELFTCISARGLTRSHGPAVVALLRRLALLELSPTVLARAREPFPSPIRTLDAMHLASADFLRSQHQRVEVASYDERFIAAARRINLPISRYCSVG